MMARSSSESFKIINYVEIHLILKIRQIRQIH